MQTEISDLVGTARSASIRMPIGDERHDAAAADAQRDRQEVRSMQRERET